MFTRKEPKAPRIAMANTTEFDPWTSGKPVDNLHDSKKIQSPPCLQYTSRSVRHIRILTSIFYISKRSMAPSHESTSLSYKRNETKKYLHVADKDLRFCRNFLRLLLPGIICVESVLRIFLLLVVVVLCVRCC